MTKPRTQPQPEVIERVRAEIHRAVTILGEPGQTIEVRIPRVDGKNTRTDAGYFQDPDALAGAVIAYNGRAHGIYITLNPVDPALFSRAANRLEEWATLTTSDKDVVRRRWLPIDVDPRRPAGISSTAEEHAAALALARNVRDWLGGLGFPAPVEADSGNGAHLLYRIDLPNDPDAGELVQRCIKAIAHKWDDPAVSIDQTVYNAARIWKLYGTKAAKGDNTEERPHRWAHLVSFPEAVEIVPVELLRNLAALAPTNGAGEQRAQDHRQQSFTGPAFDVEDFIQRHAATLNPTQKKPIGGGAVRWRIDCPWGGEGHKRDAFILQRAGGELAAGCSHNSCSWDWHGLRERLDPRPAPPERRRPETTAAPSQAPSEETGATVTDTANTAHTLTKLLDDLATVQQASGSDDIKLWALDRVEDASYLTRSERERFFIFLARAGVPERWLEHSYKKAISAAWTDRQTGARTVNGPTWDAYVTAMEELGYHFRTNDLDDTIEVNGELLTDGLEAEILMRMYDAGFDKADVVRRALTAHAHRNRYNPIKSYLVGLTWDGTDHIAKLCGFLEDKHPHIVYRDGSHRTVIHAFLRRWVIGAVAKVYEGGIARGQNPMLVLDGDQNLGKSTFVKWIGSPLPDRMLESPIHPDDREHARYLATKWVWEVVELGATLRRADLDALKGFITKTDVTFRKPYDRHPVVKPAAASFIGTINNESGFLVDPTGNRRFLPVHLNAIRWEYTQAVDINQIWAQAYALYKSGEPWALTPDERAMHASLSGDYEREDPYEGWILRLFDVAPEKMDLFTTSADIVEKLQDNGVRDSTRAIQTQLGITMRRLNLQSGRQPRTGPRGYFGIAPKQKPGGL